MHCIKKFISSLIGMIVLLGPTISMAINNDLSPSLVSTTDKQKLVIKLFYPQDDKNYLAKYELLDKNSNLLNKGKFKGCTYGGIITNIADYLKTKNFVAITPIKNGFAMHFIERCGAQSVWRLNVITPVCVASVPATNDRGEYINIGSEPHKILFGYLQGVGASRSVISDYLTIDDDGLLHLSKKQPQTLQSNIKITCKG